MGIIIDKWWITYYDNQVTDSKVCLPLQNLPILYFGYQLMQLWTFDDSQGLSSARRNHLDQFPIESMDNTYGRTHTYVRMCPCVRALSMP